MTNTKVQDVTGFPTIKRAEFQRANVTGSFWVAIIPIDHTLKDVCRPEYWAHVCDSTFMGAYNEITCQWADKQEIAKLHVRDYTGTHAAVEVMYHKNYRNTEVENLEKVEQYKVTWGDPTRKHVITDVLTGLVVKEGIQARADADAFAEDLENSKGG